MTRGRMTREEAIKYIKSRCIGSTEKRDGTQWSEAMWMAIEALADRPTEMMEDGTLAVRVSGAKDVSRVLVMDTDSHVGGGLYYVDKDNEPTGEWVEVEEYDCVCYQCDQCKSEYVLIDGTPQDNDYNYCPHCGAYMKGENK